jgi:hypothetical protein
MDHYTELEFRWKTTEGEIVKRIRWKKRGQRELGWGEAVTTEVEEM